MSDKGIDYEVSRYDPDASEPGERLLGALIILSAFAIGLLGVSWALVRSGVLNAWFARLA